MRAAAQVLEDHAVENATEFCKWWVVDELTGKRLLTTYKLCRADAARAFPGAQPDPESAEIRNLPKTPATAANGRPERRWSDSREGGLNVSELAVFAEDWLT
jgi:hypothetical protein